MSAEHKTKKVLVNATAIAAVFSASVGCSSSEGRRFQPEVNASAAPTTPTPDRGTNSVPTQSSSTEAVCKQQEGPFSPSPARTETVPASANKNTLLIWDNSRQELLPDDGERNIRLSKLDGTPISVKNEKDPATAVMVVTGLPLRMAVAPDKGSPWGQSCSTNPLTIDATLDSRTNDIFGKQPSVKQIELVHIAPNGKVSNRVVKR